jgi:hypothetical protein
MDRIIAGRFHTKGEADGAAALIVQYADSADICIFHNNPPGQHDLFGGGGDEDEDPGTRGAGRTAAEFAVAGGIAGGAVGALGGPVTAIAAGAAGAVVGSLAGALGGIGDAGDQTHPSDRRPVGIMLSVRIATPLNEKRVIATLREQGAADIEHADGTWRNGDWADFNPAAAPLLV